jgi:hypothetical protein
MLLETLARNVITAWESGDPAHAIDSLEAYLQKVDAERNDHELTICAARSNYESSSDNDIEIDDKPVLSVTPDGVWVSAWVWVRTEYDDELPTPPAGYTAEELERDSPYNQWLYGV